MCIIVSCVEDIGIIDRNNQVFEVDRGSTWRILELSYSLNRGTGKIILQSLESDFTIRIDLVIYEIFFVPHSGV